ncbi:MAG TPA: 50S ribosomal protein L30 [Myxococcaceae bacterium]|nr:50S ribosomal protein L30 [Myxococcaceae bacterium]
MGLKIKLVKSYAGAPETQLRTIAGLGLKKMGQERVLQDTPAIRGMVFKVKHLVSQEAVPEDPVKRERHKPRRVRLREQARAKTATGRARS